MKKTIAGIWSVLSFTTLLAQQRVVIQGTISGDLKGWNKIYMYTRMSNDSTEIRDGKYSFSFPFTGTEFKMLFPEYVSKAGQMYRPFGILIDQPGTYTVTSDIAKGMHESSVRGSEGTELYKKFNADEDNAYKGLNKALADRFGNEWYRMSETDPLYPSYQKARDSLQQVYLVPLVDELVRKHPGSYATVFVLINQKTMLSVEQQEKYYGMLSDQMKNADEGKKFYDYTCGIKNSAPGKKVESFSLPDPKDALVSFDGLKGKYVLIDFWASWCVPCRKSFPHLRQMYATYRKKGFEIFSISIDQNKTAWLKAVKEERNPWLQALDTKNVSQRGFAVSAVPTAYLIGPDGKIVEKQVGFDDDQQGPIDKKLEALFGSITKEKKPEEPSGKKVIQAIPMTPMN